MKKVAFYTLGCKLNFSESSTLAREFAAAGFSRAAAGEVADVCVINTCSVTSDADKKCRHAIRKAVRENPGAVVAVTGCYAQLNSQEIGEMDGVSVVVGNDNKGRVVELVLGRFADNSDENIAFSTPVNPLFVSSNSGVSVSMQVMSAVGSSAGGTVGEATKFGFFPAFSLGDRTRAFLKVQDGCNYHCAYCTIPRARGESRNEHIVNVLEQARTLAEGGVREVVLTGVNIGDFGRTTGESFLDLIKALDTVQGVERYRISSIEPNLLTDEVLDFCATSARFQPHFHVPLQAGTDKVLGLMRRRYTTAVYRKRIEAIRRRMPDAFIGIDIIVGFPGETAEDFDATVRFLEELRPAFLHIFPYSERPNTPAIEFSGKVFAEESARRVRVLGELNVKLHGEFCEQFCGTVDSVLVEEHARGGVMSGYTGHYVKVELPKDSSFVNRIVDVRLGEYDRGRGVMSCEKVLGVR